MTACAICGAARCEHGRSALQPLGSYDLLTEIVNDPRAKHLIAASAKSAKKPSSGDDVLKGVQHAIKAAFDVSPVIPLNVCAKLGRELWTCLGIKATSSVEKSLSCEYGHVALSCICFLARHNMNMRLVAVERGACVIVANVPETFWTWEGKLGMSIRQEQNIVQLSATIEFPGQGFDWGRGSKIVSMLLESVEAQAVDLRRAEA